VKNWQFFGGEKRRNVCFFFINTTHFASSLRQRHTDKIGTCYIWQHIAPWGSNGYPANHRTYNHLKEPRHLNSYGLIDRIRYTVITTITTVCKQNVKPRPCDCTLVIWGYLPRHGNKYWSLVRFLRTVSKRDINQTNHQRFFFLLITSTVMIPRNGLYLTSREVALSRVIIINNISWSSKQIVGMRSQHVYLKTKHSRTEYDNYWFGPLYSTQWLAHLPTISVVGTRL